MKKITRIFAVALALMMSVAFQVPVNAAEKAITQSSGGVYGKISYLSSNQVRIDINNPNGDDIEVQLRDYKGKVIKTNFSCFYSTFSLSKNKLYSYRIRGVYYVNGEYVPYTNWSNSVYFTTAQYKVTRVGKGRKVKIKTPKVAGIKNYKIYMSLKKNGGWKKLKTVKAGKSIICSKFKGKPFKLYTNYYYKIVPNKGSYYINGFYFYNKR